MALYKPNKLSGADAPIAIRSVGLISPLGHGAWPTFAALLKGKTIAERAGQTSEAASPAELALAAGGVSIVRHTPIDPAVELAEFAAREALGAVNLEPGNIPTYLGTSKGAVAALDRAADWAAGPHRHGEASDIDTALAAALGPHAYLAHHLIKRLGVSIQTHHVAACASSLAALHRARIALQNPDHPGFALVLTAEAALLPLFVASYQRLGVLAPLTPANYRAAPLDQSRSGFMLSEIGAAVLLERLPSDPPPPGTTLLEDTAIACEAFDMLRSSPDMPALKHIAKKLLAGRAIDVLHPHAPGTPDHDPAELAALGEILKQQKDQTEPPDVYAVKGALGHSLGAAGLTSLVIAALMLRTGQRPPMPWLENPIDTGVLKLPLRAKAQTIPRSPACPVRHAVFAAGFAGHTAGAIITRI